MSDKVISAALFFVSHPNAKPIFLLSNLASKVNANHPGNPTTRQIKRRILNGPHRSQR
jgi:hypothetical protein